MCATVISRVRTNSTDPALLHKDAHLVAFDKPAGMPVQPDQSGDPSLLDHAAALLGSPATDVGLVHRLDRPVSGVVVLALDPGTLREMNRLFSQRAVEKTYWAIVEGQAPDEGTCAHALGPDTGRRKARVGPADADATHVLRYVRLAQGERYALVQVRPEGGGFHQIRAQLAASGLPIKGDVKYGARRGEPDRSIGLHACRVAFAHPATGRPVLIEAPPPTRSIWPALMALR